MVFNQLVVWDLDMYSAIRTVWYGPISHCSFLYIFNGASPELYDNKYYWTSPICDIFVWFGTTSTAHHQLTSGISHWYKQKDNTESPKAGVLKIYWPNCYLCDKRLKLNYICTFPTTLCKPILLFGLIYLWSLGLMFFLLPVLMRGVGHTSLTHGFAPVEITIRKQPRRTCKLLHIIILLQAVGGNVAKQQRSGAAKECSTRRRKVCIWIWVKVE